MLPPDFQDEVVAAAGQPRVLILSTSMLTDRILLHTELLETLAAGASIDVWANPNSSHAPARLWAGCPASVETFPEVLPFREFPYNVLRRLNDFAWDFRLRAPSKLSIWKHVRRHHTQLVVRAARALGRLLAAARLERPFEKGLEKLLLSFSRSPESLTRFAAERPEVLVVTGPFQFQQPAVTGAAKSLGIRTLALIPSWDNPSTKNRMVLRYDGYIVWSESEKRDLQHFFPYTRNVPIYVVGAPQFDTFFQDRYRLTRSEFCAMEGLRPELPVIVHAMGSPNFLKEHHAALFLAERVARGDLGDVQLLVRAHPIHDKRQLKESFQAFGPRVVLQQIRELPVDADGPDRAVLQWVNTFRHADVVVNLASTVTIDAAIFDKPVINLDYDPDPEGLHQDLVREVNHLWTHFKPVAESGGVWNVANPDELIVALRGYLARPELHRPERAAIARAVCGPLDGRSAERMAQAILDFTSRTTA